MAFRTSPEDGGSNIFDGPMALTKERDACGVGFIANTQSGGTYNNTEQTRTTTQNRNIVTECPS
jgi:hypothetical protein